MSKRILTVDDSKTMREMVSFTLRNAGYEVIDADDGTAALDVLEKQKVDVIITDINMPQMNGFELITKLRATPNHQFVPILVLTTEFDQQKKDRGKVAGATGWIVKPFSPEKLVNIIKKVSP